MNIRAYLDSAEPIILYAGLVCVIYWIGTSPERLWIQIAVLTAYALLPLPLIKFLHREQLTSRLGLKADLAMISLAVVSVAVALISFCYAGSPVWFYGIVLAPIGEEVFFRGYMLGNLSKHGRTAAVLLSAFMFGAAHYLGTLTLEQFLSHFIVGIVLGYAYLSFRSIVVPILYHQTWNTIFGGFSPILFAFPWNFFAIFVYVGPIIAAFVTFRKIYKADSVVRRCWVCGRTEGEIERRFPGTKDALERRRVKEGVVNVCVVCRQLLAQD